MNYGNYRCTITSPIGEELDISALLEIGELGSLSWEPESDLGVMSHGDLSLGLDNSGGEIESFLETAQPDDIYEVILERERSDGAGWDRLFGGILDLPYSLSYDDGDKTATLQAFSYTKLMERSSAAGIQRTLAAKTASITNGTKTLSFLGTEASDLLPGDIVILYSVLGSPTEFTIDEILSASQALTTKAADATLTSEYAVVKTPSYRDKTPSFLLDAVATACSFELDAANFQSDLASFPIATPLIREGLSVTKRPASLVPTGTSIIATYEAADESKRKTTTGPTTAWTDGATSNVPQGDWTPYLASEPASIMESSLGGTLDTGLMAWDHTNSHVYYIVQETIGSPTFQIKLHLYQDSTDLGIFSTGPDDDEIAYYLEYDPVNDWVWISYRRIHSGSPTDIFTKIYKPGTGFVTFSTAAWGQLRCNIQHSAIILLDEITNKLIFYDLATQAVQRILTPPNGSVFLWTLRTWSTWLAVLCRVGLAEEIAIFETVNWTFLAQYVVGTFLASRLLLTIMKLSDGREVAVGFAGLESFVVSLRYDGVVRYADFSTKSCAAAARELALVTNSIVHANRYRTLSLMNRRQMGSGEVVADLGSPISSTRKPVSEIFRSSVSVTGKFESGGDINVVIGEVGDSSRRFEMKSELSTTAGAAVAAGLSTLQFIEQVREQRDVTVTDDDTLLSPFDRVTLDGKAFTIYKIDTDLEQRERSLTLLELVA